MNAILKFIELKKYFRFICISGILVLDILNGYSQEDKKYNPIELSVGYGMLIYQSGYGLDNSFGVEIAAGKRLNETLKAESGIRIGIKPLQPDVFLRLSTGIQFGKWKPTFGFETGYSNRMYFEGNNNLLKETRDAMTHNLGYFYLSSHTEILAFEFKNQWYISLLELNFGTHYKDFGTTLRLQTNFLRIRKTI
jgi:hypothetical protein